MISNHQKRVSELVREENKRRGTKEKKATNTEIPKRERRVCSLPEEESEEVCNQRGETKKKGTIRISTHSISH